MTSPKPSKSGSPTKKLRGLNLTEHIRENLIGQFATELEFPIHYVLHEDSGGFKVSIFHERYLKGAGSERDANSDIAFAVWRPDKGLMQVSSFPYITLRDAGLVPDMEEFCQEAYEAWKEDEDA